jgi:methionyl-tRNA formyltransferase
VNVVLAGNGPIAAGAYRAINALAGVSVVAAAYDGDGDLPAYVEYDGTPSVVLSTLRYPRIAPPWLRAFRADLLVLANVSFLIDPVILNTPAHGSLCFHPSLLPRHRGKDAVRATLTAGDTEAGVTIFRPDAGADTGPIVWQRSCPVPPDVSPGRLYYGSLVPLGIEGIAHAVAAVRDGRAWERPQTAPAPALHEAAD